MSASPVSSPDTLSAEACSYAFCQHGADSHIAPSLGGLTGFWGCTECHAVGTTAFQHGFHRALSSERPTLSQADALIQDAIDAAIELFEADENVMTTADYLALEKADKAARAALRAALLREKP